MVYIDISNILCNNFTVNLILLIILLFPGWVTIPIYKYINKVIFFSYILILHFDKIYNNNNDDVGYYIY